MRQASVAASKGEDRKNLSYLFEPRTVAIVGASDDSKRMGGGLVLRFLQKHGFKGTIVPVNPKYETVAGLTCYPSLEAVPEPIDVAVITVPAAAVAGILAADPEQASIHPWDAQAPDEEIMLLEHSFHSHVPEAFTNLPSYRAWIDTQDWTPAYRTLRRFLQFLQWQKRQRGALRERWVLKTPGHLGYVDTLLAVFPGARIVQTHRDPVQTIPSAASLNRSLWRLSSDDVEDREVARQWLERMAWAVKRCPRRP